MSHIPVRAVPPNIKVWLEDVLKRKLKLREEINFWAYTPGASKEYWDYYEKMRNRRERRLKAVTRKMKTLGMSETDVTCVLRGGLKEGESIFRPLPEKEK